MVLVNSVKYNNKHDKNCNSVRQIMFIKKKICMKCVRSKFIGNE